MMALVMAMSMCDVHKRRTNGEGRERSEMLIGFDTSQRLLLLPLPSPLSVRSNRPIVFATLEEEVENDVFA